MNKPDFDKLMYEEISNAEKNAKLLLHCCCAPCASSCLERLNGKIPVTAFFCNPNIGQDEYLRRKAELKRFLNETGWADFAECSYDPAAFYDRIKGLEGEKEGGGRCAECFFLRLETSADFAEKNGFGYLTTTLTVSPLKNAALINSIGERVCAGRNVKWLHSDFKKRDGYLRSVKLSKEHSLYRQNYCGCEFSKPDTSRI